MSGAGETAAILLCAGKGTRMGRNDRNKVCYDCAGTPVVKRIIANTRHTVGNHHMAAVSSVFFQNAVLNRKIFAVFSHIGYLLLDLTGIR